MTIARQYVACKFRVEDTRTYTYHHDGEPLAPGDLVRVADRSGDGWKKVHVVMAMDEAPTFPTKPILGLHTEDEPTPLEEAAARPLDCHPDSVAAYLAAR